MKGLPSPLLQNSPLASLAADLRPLAAPPVRGTAGGLSRGTPWITVARAPAWEKARRNPMTPSPRCWLPRPVWQAESTTSSVPTRSMPETSSAVRIAPFRPPLPRSGRMWRGLRTGCSSRCGHVAGRGVLPVRIKGGVAFLPDAAVFGVSVGDRYELVAPGGETPLAGLAGRPPRHRSSGRSRATSTGRGRAVGGQALRFPASSRAQGRRGRAEVRDRRAPGRVFPAGYSPRSGHARQSGGAPEGTHRAQQPLFPALSRPHRRPGRNCRAGGGGRPLPGHHAALRPDQER